MQDAFWEWDDDTERTSSTPARRRKHWRKNMKNTVAKKTKSTAFSKKAVAAIRKEEAAAGVPENVRFPKRYKIIPKDQRREFPTEAFEDRNAKVRISIYLDL